MVELAPFIAESTPILLLGVIIAFVWLNGLLSSMSKQFNDMRDDIAKIKERVTFTDTCNARHKEVDRRLEKLEESA